MGLCLPESNMYHNSGTQAAREFIVHSLNLILIFSAPSVHGADKTASAVVSGLCRVPFRLEQTSLCNADKTALSRRQTDPKSLSERRGTMQECRALALCAPSAKTILVYQWRQQLFEFWCYMITVRWCARWGVKTRVQPIYTAPMISVRYH